MNRDWQKPAIWMMWFPLAVTALNYWRAWDCLPMGMAVHFDANWQPNGYTSRQGELTAALATLAVMQVTFTLAFLIVRAQKPSAEWPMVVFFYLFWGLFSYVNHWILEFNLRTQPAHSELVGPNSPAPSNSDGQDILLQQHS
jgi:hypothetical protein